MPYKSKPYIKVGRGQWETCIPRPPKHATHARMSCVDPSSSDPTPKVSIQALQDFGCYKGVSGDFTYLRMDNKRKVTAEYDGTWYWDGTCVPEVTLMIQNEQ